MCHQKNVAGNQELWGCDLELFLAVPVTHWPAFSFHFDLKDPFWILNATRHGVTKSLNHRNLNLAREESPGELDTQLWLTLRGYGEFSICFLLFYSVGDSVGRICWIINFFRYLRHRFYGQKYILRSLLNNYFYFGTINCLK